MITNQTLLLLFSSIVQTFLQPAQTPVFVGITIALITYHQILTRKVLEYAFCRYCLIYLKPSEKITNDSK